MRYLKFATVGIGIVAVAFFAGRIFWPQEDLPLRTGAQETSAPQDNFAPQTNSEGAVNITVAPQNSLKSAVWEFAITLDTHSVELNEDLTKISFLVDEPGKEYLPTAWEGAPPGGHHREGVLKFDPIVPAPNSIKLKISGVGDIPERIFEWEVGY